VADCTEIGAVSKANASAHYLTRVHDVRMMSGAKRCFVANFNGSIDSDRTVASVKWRATCGQTAVMSNARVQTDARSSAVDVTAACPGEEMVRCEATLDNGEIVIQPFHVEAWIADGFISASSTTGPLELTATAA
jgi:hypothetical protein